MTPEGKVKLKVKALLVKYHAYYFMPVQNGMGAPALDFFGCYRREFFAIETKAGRGKVTARQQATMDQIEAAGGAVFVIDESQGSMDELESWLEHATGPGVVIHGNS